MFSSQQHQSWKLPMGTIPANLGTLIEQLEDTRQFHHRAGTESSGNQSQRHRVKSQAYAAMLAEIAQWESRNAACDAQGHSVAPSNDPVHASPLEDGYAALLDRIFRIHRAATAHTAVELVTRRNRIRAPDNAMEGEAMDGRRRAGTGVCS